VRLGARREDGQIIPMLLVGMLPFALLLALVFNTGALTVRKAQVQAAADSAALSQATLVARSLNVVAANNVAITQTFTIDVIASALMPTLIEATINAIREQKQVADLLKGCKYVIPCIIAAFRFDHYVEKTAKPLAAIWRDLGVDNVQWYTLPLALRPPNLDGTAKMEEFSDIAEALSAMNDEVVNSFPRVATEMQRSLAKTNGLQTPPRMFAGFMTQNRMQQLDFRATTLPVRRIALSASGVARSLLGDVPIKRTGELGTPRNFPREAWNFSMHGYPIARGPFPIGSATARAAIQPPVDALAARSFRKRIDFFLSSITVTIPGPNLPGQARFDQTLRTCWSIAAPTQIMPGGNCLLPFRAKRITLYELDMPLLELLAYRSGVGSFIGDPDRFSIMAFTSNSFPEGPVAAPHFVAAPSGTYGMAQADIYNEVFPDLYTQAWRAALVPGTLLSGRQRDRVRAVVASEEELHSMLRGLSPATTRAINVH